MLSFLYFLKVIVCSAIFLLYYYIVLRNKVYHQYNRFYLLFVVALSWCVPLINFEILIEPKQLAQPIYNVVEYLTVDNAKEPIVVNTNNTVAIATASKFTFKVLFYYTYIAISFIFFINFLFGLIGIFKLTQKYQKQRIGNIKLYDTQEANTPFSFFNFIFWNKSIDIDSPIGKQVLAHELAHIKQLHSCDKVFMQLNLIAGWFNPILWIMNKELSLIHEFIADKKSIPKANTALFAQALLAVSFAGKSPAFTNPFFLSPINRRLIMLSKTSLPKLSYAQRITALPLLALIVVAFSLKAQGYNLKQVATNVVNNLSNNQIPITTPDSLNQLPQKVIVVKNEISPKDTLTNKTNKANTLNGVTQEEMAEYKSYELIAFTNAEENEKKYDVSKLNATQKLRMHELYTKMSHNQKAEVDLLSYNIASKYVENKPTNELIEEWKKNKNYIFLVDHKEVDKESIKDASEYIGYLKMYTFYNPEDEKNNKAKINFTSKERLASVSKAQRFFWINTNALNTEKNQATKSELNEIMVFAIKYDPFAVGENINTAERKRIKVLYNKMNDAQKAKSPIQIFDGAAENNNDSSYSMNVILRNRF